MFPAFQRDRGAAPEQRIDAGSRITRAAFLGVDMPGLRPRLLYSQGDRVTQGEPVFCDRAHPEINFVAPLSGTIEAVTLGPRRTLSALVIAADTSADEEPAKPDPAHPPGQIDDASAASLRTALQQRGLWLSFLTRPFGRIPAPDSVPDAIFVTATADHDHAPDPRVVLAGRERVFTRGVEALTLLTEGRIHVCQTPGPDLAGGAGLQVRNCFFASGPSTGLAGFHVHRLHPVDRSGLVWTIGYQDVAAIGEFLDTGAFDPRRVIALAGPRASRPRLLRTVPGAAMSDLIDGEVRSRRSGKPMAVLSGSPASGRPAVWLGRHHQQVTLIDGAADLASQKRKTGLSALIRRHSTTPAAMVPIAALDRALSFGGPAVPLLRALSVGDAESARRLGCLGMVEEDLAAVSMICASGADYGRMLRHVLDELAVDA